MRVVVLILLVALFHSCASSSLQCLETGAEFYEFLGCEGIKNDNDTCYSAYKCLPGRANQCLFRGNYYNHDEEIVDATTCRLSCKCFIKDNYSHVLCTKVKCPYIEIEPDCHVVYEKPGDCCPTKKACPPFEFTCRFNGEVYLEGEKFSSENDCYECICKPGFNETATTNCAKKILGLELSNYDKLKDKCLPVYPESLGKPLCSPSSFICEKDTLEVKFVKKITHEVKEPPCLFNDNSYNKGDLLEVTHGVWPYAENSFCSCLTPPYLSCSDSYIDEYFEKLLR